VLAHWHALCGLNRLHCGILTRFGPSVLIRDLLCAAMCAVKVLWKALLTTSATDPALRLGSLCLQTVWAVLAGKVANGQRRVQAFNHLQPFGSVVFPIPTQKEALKRAYFSGAQPFDMATGERISKATSEQREVLMVHLIAGG